MVSDISYHNMGWDQNSRHQNQTSTLSVRSNVTVRMIKVEL